MSDVNVNFPPSTSPFRGVVAGEMEAAITEAKADLEAQLSGASVQLEATDNKVKDLENINPSINAVWKPPTMPGTIRGVDIPSGYNPDVYLAAVMDPLVDNDYITKKSIGKSSSRPLPATTLASEIYDVWRYDFTPKNYEKTILITSLIHGNEYTAAYWAGQFANLLAKEFKGDPHLEYLRRTTRIVMVPIVNPYGHAVQTRENINDVDCSRNFDYNFGVSLDEYNQGTAAWSENESVIIRDLMAELAAEGDCVASLDFHTTLSEGDTHYMLYFPRWLENDVDDYLECIEQIAQPGETTAFANVTLPTLTNWGVYKHGFIGANPEFKNGLAGSTRDSVEMTRAMKFFGNMVMLAAKKSISGKGRAVRTPKVARVNFDHRTDGGPISFGTTTYTSQGTKTSFRFNVKNEGVVEVDGFVIVTSPVDAEISIMAHLYQLGSPDFSLEDTENDERCATILNVKAGVETPFPLSNAIPCHKTNIKAANNTNERAKEVVFQLRTKTSAGPTNPGTIKFMNAKLKFTPTTSGGRFTMYGTNPARKTYPTGQETVYEF